MKPELCHGMFPCRARRKRKLRPHCFCRVVERRSKLSRKGDRYCCMCGIHDMTWRVK